MNHSLYLVYKACKYSRLNGSLSLVCRSPDSSKPEKENEGEEEGGESNKQTRSRPVQHENENNARLWKIGEWFSGVEGASFGPPPLAKVNLCADLLEHRGKCSLRPWKLCCKSDLPFQAVGVGPWAPGSILSTFWEARLLHDRGPLGGAEDRGHALWLGRLEFESGLG